MDDSTRCSDKLDTVNERYPHGMRVQVPVAVHGIGRPVAPWPQPRAIDPTNCGVYTRRTCASSV